MDWAEPDVPGYLFPLGGVPLSTTLDHGRRSAARVLSGVGLAAGLTLVTRPATLTGRLAPRYPRRRLWVARVLGARLVAQHLAVLVSPEPAALRLSAAVDGLHAASMLPVLALPRYRRAALVSGGFAAGSALADRLLAGSGPR
ncbi:hypothetical protein [Blastococcus sp. SYSU DS0616]